MVADAVWLGSITATALAVMPITVMAGQMAYITTYNFPLPSPSQIDPAFISVRAAEVCQHAVEGSIFANIDKPICATAAMAREGGIEVATLNIG
jgi:IMP cyclohydrolase